MGSSTRCGVEGKSRWLCSLISWVRPSKSQNTGVVRMNANRQYNGQQWFDFMSVSDSGICVGVKSVAKSRLSLFSHQSIISFSSPPSMFPSVRYHIKRLFCHPFHINNNRNMPNSRANIIYRLCSKRTHPAEPIVVVCGGVMLSNTQGSYKTARLSPQL